MPISLSKFSAEHHPIEASARPVSATALARAFEENSTSQPGTSGSADPAFIARQALQGETIARAAYRKFAQPLVEGIANLFNLIDPQAVILAGGLIEGQIWLIDAIQREVEARLHFGTKRQPEVRLSPLGVYAGVQGAAAAVFQAQNS